MKLLRSIRSACSGQVWSQGVKLARADAVAGESADDDEIVLRVKAPGRAVATTVVLYPDDDDWECDCPSKARVCSHVAAAVIAVGQARDAGEALPSRATESATVGYRFVRRDGGLYLNRVVVRGEDETPLVGSLTALIARHERDAELSPTHDDIAIDRLLGDSPRARLAGQRLIHVLRQMPEGTDLQLDGAPIRASHDLIVPRAHVTRWKGGARLVLERDPTVTDVVAAGVVLCGDTLHPLGETELTGPRLEALPLVQRYEAPQLGELVANVLPELAKRIAVDIRTDHLPGVSRTEHPRLDIDIRQEDGALSVLALLVYGSPPVARVDGARLVHLGGRVPVRNLAGEKRLVLQLRDELHLVVGRRVTTQGDDAVELARRLHAWSAGPGQTHLIAAPPLVPRIDTEDGFAVWFETEVDGETRRVEAAAVVRAWHEGIELVPLTGGGFAPLPLDWLAEHGHRVAALLDARDDRGELSRIGDLEAMQLCDALDAPRPPRYAGLAALIDGFEAIPEASLPRDLAADLRPYQREGVNWLCFTRDAELGALLADDMGLGKTVQALCAISGRTLVVCPRSVVHNWSDELARFRPTLTHATYHGPRRAIDANIDVTLTTYALLRLDIERLEQESWDTVILDESQAIKNPDSQVARAAYRINARHRIALTGTPIENRLEELWSQMHFTNPGLLGGRTAFRERFAGPISRGDAAVTKQLRQRIAPFLLRRLKRDVAPELPPRTDAVMYVELDQTERTIYDAVRAATRKEVIEKLGQGGGVMAALEALLRLRQASCHAALVPGQSAAGSSKVTRLVDALSEAAADGHKALVFSQWTGFLDLVEPHLEAAGIPFTRLDGSTRDRAGVVGSFQDSAGPPVMLISLKAGGTGLNLTAADHVFLMDPWWNPAVEDQAADRTHRIGQDRPVTVYRMVSSDTVEERILALQQQKRSIADAALDGAQRAASLTRDDLLALLA